LYDLSETRRDEERRGKGIMTDISYLRLLRCGMGDRRMLLFVLLSVIVILVFSASFFLEGQKSKRALLSQSGPVPLNSTLQKGGGGSASMTCRARFWTCDGVIHGLFLAAAG